MSFAASALGAPVALSGRTLTSSGSVSRASRVAPVRAEGELTPNALETLKAENELLKQAIASAEETVGQLGGSLDDLGIAPESLAQARTEVAIGNAETFEDVWTPRRAPVAGGVLKEEAGPTKPLPEHDGTDCCKWDDTLWGHADHFKYRWGQYHNILNAIENNEGGLDNFSKAYNFYGLNRGEKDGKMGIWYREWAPGARAVALVGEFNNWDPAPEHWAEKNDFGQFQLFLPDNEDGTLAIPHRSKIKARVEDCNGEWAEKIPAYIRWATQEWDEIQYNGVNWMPTENAEPGVFEQDKIYQFKYPRPERPRNLRIYECHVGMSSEEPVVNSYLDFKDNMLPRIRKLGYNAIQIMAIQEHAYYGSFGYHVTNFFGVSSRSGTPEELKALIDEAHALGMYVLCDVVHSHASKNSIDGISMWDGTDHGYFHSGARGNHWMWDSRLFNYGNWETLKFLVSNARYWMEEYKFDGYRYDGVTSMMYHHHGLQMDFTGNYNEYFGMDTDVDALVYLMLANKVCHDFYPHAITIGEDVSGMPTFCRPIEEGGIGFDYRLNMAIADKWIEVMATDDHSWNMGNITHTMTNRRYAEACVGYAESHDQALVGDKTIAFWLMDAAMYDSMSAPGYGNTSPAVDRGIALHKMIRLLTMTLGGESYLNFMGNEFGHPEWIDFPRDDTYDTSTGAFIPGNGGSLDKCRRRWDICDAENLRYKEMNSFDIAMNHLDKAYGFISAPHQWISRKDEGDKLVVVERGDLVFVFNFHPTNSYPDYRVGCYQEGPYKVVLSSDEPVFGGYSNVTATADATIHPQEGDYDNRPYSMQVYAPSRTVVVYAPANTVGIPAEGAVEHVPGLYAKGTGPYYER